MVSTPDSDRKVMSSGLSGDRTGQFNASLPSDPVRSQMISRVSPVLSRVSVLTYPVAERGDTVEEESALLKSLCNDYGLALQQHCLQRVSKSILSPPSSPRLEDLSGKEEPSNITNSHANPILDKAGIIPVKTMKQFQIYQDAMENRFWSSHFIVETKEATDSVFIMEGKTGV
ncbi:hypothetical protein WISP_132377 [Willisornis vidua]|uniref:Uncharacterized protein n=1 Tax=Willisornis vidua TaxID=1566151 RepID=A0ABQ9CPC9_9PASS|nr:hypothetical protein WISP_132377 [Willisornis vidua]